MIPDLSRRATTTELMDTEPCDFADYQDCLENLARVNRMTLAYRPTLAFLDRLFTAGLQSEPGARPLTILDVGCGAGDMLRRVAAWAERRRIAVNLIGIDANPRAARVAESVAPQREDIRWVTGDLFTYRTPDPVDVVISSLFTHHLDNAALVRFLTWMERTARRGWFVNDLHRHAVPYVGFRLWSRAARWHRFVQYDGPVSIARAFRPPDWRHLLAEARIPDGAARLSRHMPFRLCVERIRHP